MPHLRNGPNSVSEIISAGFQDYDRIAIHTFLELPIRTTELADTSFPLLGVQTLHPTPKSCVLMLGLGLGFFEGVGGVITVPPARWPLRVSGIKPNLWTRKEHRRIIAKVLLTKISCKILDGS
jgi:hypothetical protein